MPPWTQMPDSLAAALLLGACLTAFMLLGLLDDDEIAADRPSWGDDPAVLAMLSGMSL